MAMVAMTTMMVIAFACSGGANDDDDNNGGRGDTIPDPPVLSDHVSLKGSDYYIVSLDELNFAALEAAGKVKQDIRMNGGTRQFYLWIAESNGALTYEGVPSVGPNAYGNPVDYVAIVTTGADGWSGAAFTMNDVDLSGIYNEADKYYYHFAIKSPTNQTTSGHTFQFNSQSLGAEINLFFGPENASEKFWNATWYADYPHDGEWHHFDIPVSLLVQKGWIWGEPYSTNVIVMTSGGVAGIELDIDAIFFYKKP